MFYFSNALNNVRLKVANNIIIPYLIFLSPKSLSEKTLSQEKIFTNKLA